MDYLFICSSDLVSGTTDRALYDLQFRIENKRKASLMQFSCPNVFYNVTASNNILKFNDGTANWTVQVLPGAYSLTNLLSAIETALNGSGTSLTFTVTADATFLTVTIAATGNFVLYFSLPEQLNSLLGFDSVDTASASSQTGTNCFDLGFPEYLLITIPQFKIRYNSTNVNRMCTFIVPIDANTSEVINYRTESDWIQTSDIHEMYMSQLGVTITDENGKALDFQGAQYSMIIGLH